MTARRLLLRTDELEVLRRSATPHADLPPGFVLEPRGDVDAALAAAHAALARRGLVGPEGAHAALAADLRVLAAAEVAVLVRAERPGLQVRTVLAAAGRRGVGLLRTDDAHVQLSAFRAVDLGVELARVVPAPDGPALDAPVEMPLVALLADRPGGSASSLQARVAGSLRATVVSPRRCASVHWVWLHRRRGGGGWAGLHRAPDHAGEPTARVVPVAPGDLGAWLAPAVAQVLAERAAA